LALVPVLITFIGAAMKAHDASGPGVAALVCGVLMLFILIPGTVRLTEDEYYSLSGSRDSQGNHSCVHCGARGVYRHSPYKTNHTDADCPKCKAALWRGPKD
jgi:uncharacterized paraquat-inducible protein A